MIITLDKLGEVSKTFLEILARENVNDMDRLQSLAGQAIPVKGKPLEYVTIEWRPSNLDTSALDASYIIQHAKEDIGGGIPLNVRLNKLLDYTSFIVKAEKEIGEGYNPFLDDGFGNIVQEKIIQGVDWSTVVDEVKRFVR